MIYLIACSSKKGTMPTQARDLYQGQAFKFSRQLAEKTGADYWILSALHGLVHPEEKITPYNEYLGGMTKAQRTTWAIKTAQQIKRAGLTDSPVTFLAGGLYAEPLAQIFTHANRPLAGMGIGQQLNYLKTQLEGKA
jgi:hypothetical protein